MAPLGVLSNRKENKMRHIIKSITSGHGVTCDTWEVNSVSTRLKPGKNGYIATGNVSLYLNHQAQIDSKVILDNATFSVEISFVELLAGDPEKKIYEKLLLSNVVDGVETNTLQTSHSGTVSLVGGVYNELQA